MAKLVFYSWIISANGRDSLIGMEHFGLDYLQDWMDPTAYQRNVQLMFV